MNEEQNEAVKQTQKPETQTLVEEKVEEKSEAKTLLSNLLSTQQWLRFIFMMLFSIIICVLTYIVGALVLLQFIFVILTGGDNQKLRHLGSSFSIYISQILQFLTYNSEDKPFPFADWPKLEDPGSDKDNPLQ